MANDDTDFVTTAPAAAAQIIRQETARRECNIGASNGQSLDPTPPPVPLGPVAVNFPKKLGR